MLVQAPVKTCDWHIICFLEGNSLPFQKRSRYFYLNLNTIFLSGMKLQDKHFYILLAIRRSRTGNIWAVELFSAVGQIVKHPHTSQRCFTVNHRRAPEDSSWSLASLLSPDPCPDPCSVLLITPSLPHLRHCTWLGVCAGLAWFSVGNFAVISGHGHCLLSACPHLQPSSGEVCRGEQPWHFSCYLLPADSSGALLYLSGHLTTSPCCVHHPRLQPWLECTTSCPWLVAHFLSSSSSSHNLTLLLSECIHMQVTFASARVQVVAAVAWLLQLQAWPSASCTCLSSSRHCSVLQHPTLCRLRHPLAISAWQCPLPPQLPFHSWLLKSTLLSPKWTFQD